MKSVYTAVGHRDKTQISGLEVDINLQTGSCVVDIELDLNCPIEEREAIISDMYAAGYKLRSEDPLALTFLKELDL